MRTIGNIWLSICQIWVLAEAYRTKSVFDPTIKAQGVLLNKDVRSTIYQTVQSTQRWLLAPQVDPEPKKAKLCSANVSELKLHKFKHWATSYNIKVLINPYLLLCLFSFRLILLKWKTSDIKSPCNPSKREKWLF